MHPHQEVWLVRGVGLPGDGIDGLAVAVNPSQHLARPLSRRLVPEGDGDAVLAGGGCASCRILPHVGCLIDHAHHARVDHL
jgi:hypothetical protein